MDYFDGIYGNDRLKADLLASIGSGVLPHAHIFEGPPGSGRFMMAKAVCMALAKGQQRDKIERDICPDIIYIKAPPGKSILPVDTVRTIREQVYLVPNDLSFKAYLIFGADQMNEAAQNAFLKLLEEPPAGVYFFLMCESAAKLLPTVRSRACTHRMQLFSGEELTEFLCRSPEYRILRQQNSALFTEALKESGGAIGAVKQAVAVPEAGRTRCYDAVKELLDLLKGSNKSLLIEKADLIPEDREEMRLLIEHLAKALRDIFCFKQSAKAPLLFFDHDEQAEEYVYSFSDDNLLKMLRLCLETLDKAEMNLNVKVARLGFLEALWEPLKGY